jgi:hypothetical protein
MPFGIPVSQDAAFGDLITGVEANVNDLSQFGTTANKSLLAAATANKADLSRPFNRLVQSVTRGRGTNTRDLGTVANALAIQLASGTNANAVDIAQGTVGAPSLPPPPPTDGSPPPTSAIVWAIYFDDLRLGRLCHFVLRSGAPGSFPADDQATGYHAYGNEHATQAEALSLAQDLVRTQCSGGGNGNGTNPTENLWSVYVDNPANVCHGVVRDVTHTLPIPMVDPATGYQHLGGEWPTEVAASATLAGYIAQGNCTHHIGNGGCDTPPCDTGGNGGTITEPPDNLCSFIDLSAFIPVDGLPPPGSQAFCQFLDDLEAQLSGFVQAIRDWVAGSLNRDAFYNAVWAINFDTGFNPLVSGFLNNLLNFFKLVLEIGAPFIDTVLCVLRGIIDFATRLTPQCGADMGIPLLLCKWIVDSLEVTELGTDAFAWAILKPRIHLGPLREFLDKLLQWALPLEIPSPPEATRAWLRNTISDMERDCIWRLHGLCPAVYEHYARAESEILTPQELLQYSYRQNWTDEQRDKELKWRGWQIDQDRQARQELHWELPTIQDHLHWLSRNVDDRDYVQRFGLLDGFATEQEIRAIPGWATYTQVVDPHGRNFWQTFGHDLTAQGVKPEVAAFHYASHWIQPSPEQMREFVYRLRPNAPGMEIQFTPEDYERILTEQDYAPLARKWFVATLPRVPALTYIIGMYRAYRIDDAALKNYHQDLGYTAQDSDRFVEVDKLQRARMRANEYRGWSPTKIANAFAMGRLDASQVEEKLTALGGRGQDAQDLMDVARLDMDRTVFLRARSRQQSRTAWRVTQALDVGALDETEAERILTELGYPASQAHSVVQSEVAAGRTKVVRQTVMAVRRSLHDGYITGEQASDLLDQAGIVPDKRDQYLGLWAIQNTPRRKRRTASQIVTDLANGMMDTNEALIRLYNLGYDQADQMLYLADAQAKIVQRDARSRAAAQRDARTRAAALQRLEQQAQRQARELRRELEHNAPRSALTRWLKRGIISIAAFRVRMEALGYPDADISRYLADAPTQPTVAELQGLAKKKVIDEPAFRAELARLGFAAVDVDYFARAAFPPPPPPAP